MSVREGADNGAIADENAAENSCGISKEKKKDNRGKISKKIPKRNAGSVREGADNGAIADENAAENSCGISKKVKR